MVTRDRDWFSRTCLRAEWGLVVGWGLLALLLDVSWVDLSGELFPLALALPLALWLGLAGLAALVASRGICDRDRAGTLVLLAGLAAAGALQWQAGDRVAGLAKFLAMRHRYRAVVAALERGQPPPSGTAYRVEPGPPLRVAFPWPGGFLDNWSGVVYDPSGLVRRARAFRRDFSNFNDPALGEVKHLFGGDLYRCEPLGGPWYLCHFT